ncbi:uncharacterized protein LOC123695055 [Colias croceus]|uniref:uncharacterized protein LOC123695055 n=1 Tax=Colias crocea TaxID=72248 RepID=UPI001E28186C|nr:uncharacterized protein LOC123695055 [Colias croceus]
MANLSRRLRDGEIIQNLMNLDESECEDIDEEDEEDLNLEQEDISEEVVPRPLDESDWDSSDDEPLFSIARANATRRSRNRPLRWDHTNNFGNSSRDLYDDPPLVDPVTLKPTHEYFSRYIDPRFF